jgi:uncharacterized membrane protein YebE (DUF533 family)
MNDWFEAEVPIDAPAAAIIARAMRAVARADGVIHQRELNLIASFETDLPADAPQQALLEGDGLRSAYLRSMIMVALADGVISEAELAKIRELAGEQGIAEAEVEAAVLSVKRRFLSVFAGVNVFRDAVVRVARDLGLSESEVDALSQEA